MTIISTTVTAAITFLAIAIILGRPALGRFLPAKLLCRLATINRWLLFMSMMIPLACAFYYGVAATNKEIRSEAEIPIKLRAQAKAALGPLPADPVQVGFTYTSPTSLEVWEYNHQLYLVSSHGGIILVSTNTP
jgi:uncharacterized membrane protein